MDSNRITKKVFNWDLKFNNSWSSHVKFILNEVEMSEVYHAKSTVSPNLVWASLYEKHCNKWSEDIYHKPKLRTYVRIKESFDVENYVLSFISRRQRSIVAQLRCGILPLAIETGRWYGIDHEMRICKLCNNGSIENEEHFVFLCNYFDTERDDFLSQIQYVCPDFHQKSIAEKF